jgi:3'-5' exoribonuclease
MRGKTMIADLQEGAVVDSWFLIADSSLKPSQSGNDYLELRLTDSSGDIVMRIWHADASLADAFRPPHVLEVSQLKVDSYRGKRQFSLDASAARRQLHVRDARDSDMALLVQSTSRDPDGLLKTLRSTVRSIKDPGIRYLMTSIVSDEAFMSRFGIWPAAVRHHHAYRCGLLEHTVGVLTLCKSVQGFYNGVHGDLLTAGAILHDVGKLEAYDYDPITGTIRMSKHGILCDHIVLGIDILRGWLARSIEGNPKFAALWPDEYTTHLEHMILSHHGKLEWGSPVEPATIEALTLHLADYLDSRINKVERYIQSGCIAPGEHVYSEDLRANVYIGDFGRALSQSDQAVGQSLGLVPGQLLGHALGQSPGMASAQSLGQALDQALGRSQHDADTTSDRVSEAAAGETPLF